MVKLVARSEHLLLDFFEGVFLCSNVCMSKWVWLCILHIVVERTFQVHFIFSSSENYEVLIFSLSQKCFPYQDILRVRLWINVWCVCVVVVVVGGMLYLENIIRCVGYICKHANFLPSSRRNQRLMCLTGMCVVYYVCARAYICIHESQP